MKESSMVLTNEHDAHLKDFFADLNNIEDYKCNVDSLEEFHQRCLGIVDKRLYSDINLQDESGNTYLHHAFKYGKKDWILKLLSHGADPLLKNAQGKNAYCMHKLGQGNCFWDFSEITALRFFNSTTWNNTTAGFCDNALQSLLGYFKDKALFSSMDEVLNFLKSTHLDSAKNQVMLVGSCILATGLAAKVDWFIHTWSSPSNACLNTIFMSAVLKRHRVFGNDEYQSLMQLLSLDVQDHPEMLQACRIFLQSCPNTTKMDDAIYQLLLTCKRSHFNLGVSAQAGSLLQAIEQNKRFHKIYMDVYLPSGLTQRKASKI